jgi:hypothetical protein
LEYLDDPDTREAFENVAKRWRRYESLFATVPFNDVINDISKCIREIEAGWAEYKTWQELEARMKQLAVELNTIENRLQYIEPWLKMPNT